MIKNYCVAAVLLVLASCSPSPETPEGLLKMYVNDVTTKKVDKDYYLKYTTDELKESVEDLTEEEVANRSFSQNVKRAKVNILNKNCQNGSCVLTYVVSYDTVERDKTKFATETKKLAEIRKEEGVWKIANITHLKTFHDSREPINALEEN